MKLKKYKWMVMIIIPIICFTSGCTQHKDNGNYDLEIKDIVYKKNKIEDDFTVYIKENNIYTPYIVITDNYGGSILVLRKHLLNEQICFNETKSQGSNGGYYSNSNIDQYLNNDFILRFSPAMQKIILSTPVQVSTLDGVKGGGVIKDVEFISRKIFLLSATEMNIRSGMASEEGKSLSYFKIKKNFIACTEEGIADAYWLRSAYHWDDIQAWTIGADGGYGGSSISLCFSLRPAFCLDINTKIQAKSDIIQGKTVYVIE